MFYPIEKAKGLNDLKDTSIVTPKNNDILLFDGDEWVNSDVLKEQEVTPSKNLLPLNEAVNKDDSRGLTFSVNSSDGSITVNGITTSDVYYRIASYFTVAKTGTYKLLGTPSDATGRREIYVFPENTGVGVMADLDGTGATAELTAGIFYGASIYVKNGVTLNNAVYKPMLTTDLNATYSDYTPYVPTIKEQLKNCEVVPGKNLLPIKTKSQILNSIPIVVESNNGVLVKVPANPTTTNIYLLGDTSVNTMTLPAGTYRLCGTPTGLGNRGDYYIQGFGDIDYKTGVGIIDYGEGVTFTLTHENRLYFFISIRNTFTTGGNLHFLPMITTDISATYIDYEPYYIPVKDAMLTQTQNSVLGAKNIAVGKFYAGNENNITWTVDSDNVVTITAPSGNVGPANITSDVFTLPKGSWILSKNPVVNISGVRLGLLVNGDVGSITTSEEISMYHASDLTNCKIRLYVPTTTGPLNVKFYPMIRPLGVKDKTFAPPSKTNRELTDELTTEMSGTGGIITKVTSGNSIISNSTFAEKYGKIVVVHIGVKFSANVDTTVKIATMRDMPLLPSASVQTSAGVVGTSTLDTNGNIYLYNPRLGWTYSTLVYVCK